ncbi:alpha/beta fold hydrolase [Frateuria aurantia]
MLYRRLKFLGVLAGLALIVFGGGYLFEPRWLMRANDYRQAVEAHLNKKQVLAGDTNWVYYEGGTGPTLLLLHGFGSNKEVWLPLAAKLTPRFHVVIPDLPGWGESSRDPAASYNLNVQAQRLENFVQAIHLPGMILVGHSMGGGIAGLYALAHPDHVAGLVLMDSIGLKSNDNAFTREVQAGHDPFIFDDRAGFYRALDLAFEHPPKVPARFADVFVQRNQQDRAFIEKTFKELTDPSQVLALQNHLAEFITPVMGLWCRNDKIVDYSALESLRNGLSHAHSISATTINDCGHMPMLEKTDEVGQILSSFAMMR